MHIAETAGDLKRKQAGMTNLRTPSAADARARLNCADRTGCKREQASHARQDRNILRSRRRARHDLTQDQVRGILGQTAPCQHLLHRRAEGNRNILRLTHGIPATVRVQRSCD